MYLCVEELFLCVHMCAHVCVLVCTYIMLVCIYVSLYVHICVCLSMYLCLYVFKLYLCVHVCAYLCVRVCIVLVYACLCLCVHTCVLVCAYMCLCGWELYLCIPVCICMCADVYIYCTCKYKCAYTCVLVCACMWIVLVYECVYLWVCLIILVCTCKCVCVCMCVYTQACTCMWRPEDFRCHPWAHQSPPLRQGLSVAWSSPIRLGQLAREPPGLLSLSFSAGTASGSHRAQRLSRVSPCEGGTLLSVSLQLGAALSRTLSQVNNSTRPATDNHPPAQDIDPFLLMRHYVHPQVQHPSREEVTPVPGTEASPLFFDTLI